MLLIQTFLGLPQLILCRMVLWTGSRRAGLRHSIMETTATGSGGLSLFVLCLFCAPVCLPVRPFSVIFLTDKMPLILHVELAKKRLTSIKQPCCSHHTDQRQQLSLIDRTSPTLDRWPRCVGAFNHRYAKMC